MADFNLEISGKLKSTTKGNADWYYGGGNEAWVDLATAKEAVPLAVRAGKTVGVLEAGKIVEYIWHNIDLTDNGLVLKTSAALGATNLSNTPNPTGIIVASDTGTDTTLPAADVTNAGLLLPTDKIKLDRLTFSSSRVVDVNGIEDNANAALSGLVNKVDKVVGKGLSTEDYTTSEKNKLLSIDAAHYGAPLQSIAQLVALPESSLVDKVRHYVENDLSDYFYDINATTGDQAPTDQTLGTGFWRRVSVGGETASSIKVKYESNANTNAFTDTLLAKINSITEIFTTALKSAYDSASSWITTNGATVLAHIANVTTNPHNVTKANVGLGNVDNTADLDKPVSSIQQSSFDLKVDKVAGKVLSTEDYTTSEKAKIVNVPANTNTELGNKKNILNSFNFQTGTTYQIISSDNDKVIVFENASNITMTIPTNAVDALPIGFSLEYLQAGAGMISLSSTGITMVSDSNLVSKIGLIIRLIKINTDTWVLKGDNLGGEIDLKAYTSARSDGALPLNKVFSVNSLGKLGLYDITVFSPPFVDQNTPISFSINILYSNYHLFGDFFTTDSTFTITGVASVILASFISPKEVIISFTSPASVGFYDLTINNGISRTFINFVRVQTGTVFLPNINSWTGLVNLAVDSNGSLLPINTTAGSLKYAPSLGDAILVQKFNHLVDFEVLIEFDKSPYFPSGNGIGRGYLSLYDIVTNAKKIELMFDSGGAPYNPYLYGQATASYGQIVNNTLDGFTTIFRFRWVAGVMSFWENNTLKITTNETLPNDLELRIINGGQIITNVTYIEL